MRIRGFYWNVEQNELEQCTLKDCTVVIDGHNFFYKLYQKSGLRFEFGCESDKFAEFLREYLKMFQDANVKCYFIFKGGNENLEKKKEKGEQLTDEQIFYQDYNEIVLPVLAKDVRKEVLDQMSFDYVTCEFESKKQCIALAQKLKCPIISFDVEFCFSGVSYIPYSTLAFKSPNKIECGIFRLKTFLNKYKITTDAIPIFIILTDENIFPKDFFNDLFRKLRLLSTPCSRNTKLLLWLSRNTKSDVLDKIFKHLTTSGRKKFDEELKRLNLFICRKESPGIPVEYLCNKKQIDFQENDPAWFEKGVALGRIPIPYINLYHWKIQTGSWCIEDQNADDAMLLSLDIIKYAYNLLHNYEKNGFSFKSNNDGSVREIDLTGDDSVQEPSCLINAINSPFENGWNNLNSSELFTYFLEKSITSFNFESIQSLPNNAKLLILALAYFTRHKSVDVTCEVYSIIFSYIMLDIVDTNSIKKEECDGANAAIAEFFLVEIDELIEIFDRKLLHLLVEFQHCLVNLNYLNMLCGSPYKPTMYSRTYNGTLVYKIMYAIKHKHAGKPLDFISKKLCSAPTAWDYYCKLLSVYNNLLTD